MFLVIVMNDNVTLLVFEMNLCFVVLVTALVIVMDDNVTFACLPCLLVFR
jgi:hypothetical protein